MNITEKERIKFYEDLLSWTGEQNLGVVMAEALGGGNPESVFATAPGSTMKSRHHAFRGGLMVHCAEVFAITSNAMASLKGYGAAPWSSHQMHEVFLAAMLHDMNKVEDFSRRPLYIPNTLKGGNISDAKPWKRNEEFFKVDPPRLVDSEKDRFIADILQDSTEVLGDGRISLALVNAKYPDLYHFLGDDVKQAIEIHDGGYSAKRSGFSGSECQLAIALHYGDMISSRQTINNSTNWETVIGEIPAVE